MELTEFNNFLKTKYKTDIVFFDQFMEEALYSEFGFFNTKKVRSKKSGDFLTSPEVSKYFGKVINNWIKTNSLKSNIVELGSGTGSLIEQITHKKISAIELSLTARKELRKKNIENFESIDNLSFDSSDLVFGNEVLDNIPCSIAIYKNNKWFEKAVKLSDQSLSYHHVEARDEVLDWININGIQGDENIEVEVQINTDQFLEDISIKLNPQYYLFFDYGFEQKDRKKRKYKSLLRTYKDHHLGVDPIQDPGNVDITYDVNFSSVSRKLETLGYRLTLLSQNSFLIENGFNEYFDQLQNQLLLSEGLENLTINSELSGLKALIDSNGLGGFYCLIAKKI